MPNKYKVEFVHKEFYVIDVLANNEAEAQKKAEKKLAGLFRDGTYHYYECQDDKTEVNATYNVTNTDDPFSP